MGWNGSDNCRSVAVPNAACDDMVNGAQKLRARVTLRILRAGLFVGLIVFAIGCVMVWCLYDVTEEQYEAVTGSTVTAVGIDEFRPSDAVTNDNSSEISASAFEPPMTIKKNVAHVRQTIQMRTLADGTKEPLNKPYFANPIERAISTLCNPGGMAIPLTSAMKRFSDEEIMQILKSPIEYDKDDSEFILERKMEMWRIKKEILEYVADGHSVREALAEADKTIRRDSSYLMMMRRSMQEALATKDGEVIRKYTQQINEKLEARGMKGFEVPKHYQVADTQHIDSDTTISEKETENNEIDD